jgi:hypothetical protein
MTERIDDLFEARLRSSLRGVLDAESGPHHAWADSPAARRVADGRGNVRQFRLGSLRLLAAAAVLAIGGAAAVGAGAFLRSNQPNVPLPTPAPAVPALSPTPAPPPPTLAGAIAYVNQNSIVVERPGAPPYGLGDASVIQSCPQFSKEGELAYAEYTEAELQDPETPSWQVVFVGLGANESYEVLRHLTINVRPDPDNEACFELSPDGSRVAYTVLLGNDVVLSVDSDSESGMLLNVGRDNAPLSPDLARWKPDGSELAFAVSIDPEGEARNAYSEIWLSPIGVPGARVLLQTQPNETINDLAWSPDGSKLAYRGTKFTVVTDGLGTHGDPTGTFVRVVTLDGVHTTRLDEVSDPEFTMGAGPAWSPDGSELAWVLGGEVRVGPSDGSGWRALPPVSSDILGTGWANSPVIWSGDGTRLLVGQLDEPFFDRGVESSLVIYEVSSVGQPTGFQPWQPGSFGRVTWEGGSQ